MATATVEKRTTRTRAGKAKASGRQVTAPEPAPVMAPVVRKADARIVAKWTRRLHSLTEESLLLLRYLGATDGRESDALAQEIGIDGRAVRGGLRILSQCKWVEATAGSRPIYRVTDAGGMFLRFLVDQWH